MTAAALSYTAHPSTFIDEPCDIGEGTTIWHFCHISAGARIGRACMLGQNVFVAGGAVIGDGVRIQNNVSIYDGTVLEDDVFIGPSAVLTNVINPRAAIDRRAHVDVTHVGRGATIGANATIACGITIGRHAFIGAGAVVTADVPDYALVVGVPARHSGWMSRHGHKLLPMEDGLLHCPESGYRYEQEGSVLRCLDLAEDAPLPGTEAAGDRARLVGVRHYRDFLPPPSERS